MTTAAKPLDAFADADPGKIAALIALPPEHGGLLGRGDLWRFGSRLRREGHDREKIERLMLNANRTRCAEPVSVAAVRSMARRICDKYAAGTRPLIPRLAADRYRAELAALAEYAATGIEWRGRGAASERRLLTALVTVAYGCARMTFTASERQLAELAGMKRDTLRKARGRLIASGLLETVRDADKALTAPKRPTPTKYRLRLPAAARRDSGQPTGQTWSIKAPHVGTLSPALLGQVCPPADHDAAPGADAWRPKHAHGGGFGESARVIWLALAARPDGATVADLAAANGPSRKTINRALTRLAAAALVRCDDGGRWTLTGRDPADALAEKACNHGCKPGAIVRDCSTHDAKGRQRRQHEAERQDFDENRARERDRFLRFCDRRKAQQARAEQAHRSPLQRAAAALADRKALLRRQAAHLAAMNAANEPPPTMTRCYA